MSAYFRPTPPRVLAHRGLTVDVDGTGPAWENTIHAFHNALAVGATYVETDVHSTLDGIAVLSHDPDLTYLTGQTSPIDRMTLAQLQLIGHEYGQSFPTLQEALTSFPAAFFNIDIKARSAVGPTVEAVLGADALQRVLVTSFSERRRRAAIKRLPGVATSASAPRFAFALVFARLGLTWVTRLVLRNIHAVQVPQRALGITVATRTMIQRFHAAKVEVHIWTVNDAETMAALLRLGVDGIVTDRADIALAVTTEYR